MSGAIALPGGGDRRPSLLAHSALECGGARSVDGCRALGARRSCTDCRPFGKHALTRIRTAVRCGREGGGDELPCGFAGKKERPGFSGQSGSAGGGWRSITPDCRLAGQGTQFFRRPSANAEGLFLWRPSIRESPLSRRRSLRSPTRKPPGRSNKRPGWRIRPSAFPGGKA